MKPKEKSISAALPPELDPLVDAFRTHLNGLPKLSENTRAGYVTRLRGYLRWLDTAVLDGVAGDALTDFRSAQHAVIEYRRWMMTAGKRSGNTVNAHLTAVEAFYAWRGIAVSAPRLDVVPNRRALEADERARLDNFLATAPEPGEVPDARFPLSKRDQALLKLLRYTGVRLNELAALDLDDIPMTDRAGAVKVRYGKGGKARDIPIAPLLRPALELYRPWRIAQAAPVGGERDPLLLTQRRPYRRLGDDGIGAVVADAGTASGIEGLTAHVLRHTFATELREHGVDRRLIAALLGHATSTTDNYTAPEWSELVDALSAVYPATGRRRMAPKVSPEH